jgi:beta-N-acetylhexosaminidase
VSEPPADPRRARRPASTRRRAAARGRAALRRRRALAAVAAAALVGGAIAGAGTSDGDGTSLPHLSKVELAGIRIVTGFHGRHPPKTVRRLIADGRVSGVILFADNFDTVAQARRLTRRLQRIRRPHGLRSPLVVMVDQEGGLVKRLPGPPAGSAEAMGHHGAAYVRRQGSRTARMLRRAGVNIDLAPVLDVARPGSAIGAEHRAFGHTPRRVSSRGNAFAAGLASRGVAATAKHFPGFGAARTNTDVAVQRIDLPLAKLRSVDERPYRGFIGDSGAMVMLSTAIYPHLSPMPAALSGRIATGELRHRLGFQGVSISDALDTAAARAVGGPAQVARLGASAGTDLLLFGSPSEARAASNALAQGLRRHRLDLSAFHRSERRILALRATLSR